MHIGTDKPSDDEDDILFDTEDGVVAEVAEEGPPWRMLVVDDDPGIHDVTVLLLSDFRFQGRSLEILHAYSGAECREVFEKNTGIALVLMDVVMETDSAGLDAIRYIRLDPENTLTQIVVRTGQPGASSEGEVLNDFEVDDYQDKTELSADRLRTVVETALGYYSASPDLMEDIRELDLKLDMPYMDQ